MIKIVHIAKPVGGVGVYIQLLSKYIDNNLFSNSIICNTNDKIFELKDFEGNLIPHHHVNIQREISILNDFKCYQRIISLLKELKPDLIHCHSAKAGVLGRIVGNRLGIPTLYTPHAYSYLSSEKNFKKGFFKLIEKQFRNANSKTLACSNSEYNRTIQDLHFSKEKIFVWNNSVPKIELKVSSEIIETIPKYFICSIGRPCYQKNTELLIKSIKEVTKTIDNIHLVILGVGLYSPLLEKTKSLISSLQLEDNITLIPWLKREESLSIVEKSMFLVSTSRYEGLPYAVIEALALGKACVLTDVDGNRDLVENTKNGFLVKEVYTDISKKIIQLYTDKALLDKQSQVSYQMFLNKFEITNNIKNLEAIYQSIL